MGASDNAVASRDTHLFRKGDIHRILNTIIFSITLFHVGDEALKSHQRRPVSKSLPGPRVKTSPGNDASALQNKYSSAAKQSANLSRHETDGVWQVGSAICRPHLLATCTTHSDRCAMGHFTAGELRPPERLWRSTLGWRLDAYCWGRDSSIIGSPPAKARRDGAKAG